MNAVYIDHMIKHYPAFTLDVGFAVKEGHVCALAGANGAGKTTTLKGITGLIPVEGRVEIFGIPAHAPRAKAMIGYAGGGFRFYPHKRLSAVTRAVSAFYPQWDAKLCEKYFAQYELDPTKEISELSEGMKVKVALTLALSHGARLIILDEPTSGLDPLSRADFCDSVFRLSRDEGVSVLFSTHIVSDLTDIADDVVYLSNGKTLIDEPLESLRKRYDLIEFRGEPPKGIIGVKESKDGHRGLVPRGTVLGATRKEPTLDEIIVHLEYERRGKCSHS